MTVLDYHEPAWPIRLRELTRGEGVSAPSTQCEIKRSNAVRDRAEIALQTVMSDGRLAAITGDPPQPERRITVANVYVRPDGRQLAALAELLGAGNIVVPIAATYPIEDAATALAAAATGRAGGAIVLSAASSSRPARCSACRRCKRSRSLNEGSCPAAPLAAEPKVHAIVPVGSGSSRHLPGMSSADVTPTASFAMLRELGQQLRVDSIRASNVNKSGHPTSSMSAADLMAVLFARHLRYDFDHPENALNDHVIFSKGHASPLLYPLYAAVGAISEEELLVSAPSGAGHSSWPK